MNPQEAINSLAGLIYQLNKMVERDPEQEIKGMAERAFDAAFSEAKTAAPDDPVVQAMPDAISAEVAVTGEPVRAADALIAAEALRGALWRHMPPQTGYAPDWLK